MTQQAIVGVETLLFCSFLAGMIAHQDPAFPYFWGAVPTTHITQEGNGIMRVQLADGTVFLLHVTKEPHDDAYPYK